MNRKKGLTNEEAYKILFEDIPDDTDTEVEDSSDDERNVATEEQDNFSSVFDKLLAAEEATVDQTVTQPPSGNDECLLQDPEGNTSCNENDSMQTKTPPPKDAPRGWKKKTVTTEIPEYLHPEEATVDQTVTQPPSGNDECLLQDPEGNTSCNENDSMQTKTPPPKDAPRGWKKKTVTTEIPEYLHPEGNIVIW
ncbi:uncharacterized protein LOC134545492 [Bacillus rossius redtenbacheri]|uniref:uncharacterized protein LOC134545492 n=1 Tax=Bacillus rossius redtenbacheri TaxID=93214 RepID=UPI002FDE6EF7